ncbi:hypothetical protein [Hymenobacter canadensis]|uniref:Uncharacterized protein n=1 Tax=Hymenobacter canadensis TaxID=2999067 RepID=A0ABY7LYH0_9BACT|nr:hypothetical protein [Hymenobacter canadensis]WBA43815.1 hypothetical protein O3303_09655 [Hymenobacter canadensis]
MNHAARIEETIQNIYDTFSHPGKHPVEAGLGAIDSWIQALDGLGGSALLGIQSELRDLRGYVQNDDRPAMAATLQRLGEHTALTARDLHDGTGDQLRHLGQTLITAAGNLKMA